MALYELFGPKGDEGMLVAGMGVDMSYREESDALGKHADRLLTISDPEGLLDEEALKIAAQGLRDRLHASADSDN